MPSQYPGQHDVFVDKVQHVDPILAADMNAVQDGVAALQSTVGTTAEMPTVADISSTPGTPRSVGYLLKKLLERIKTGEKRVNDLEEEVVSLSVFTYTVKWSWAKGPAAGAYPIRIENLKNPHTGKLLGYAPDVLTSPSGSEGWTGLASRIVMQTKHFTNGFELTLFLTQDMTAQKLAQSLSYTVVGFSPALRGTKTKAGNVLSVDPTVIAHVDSNDGAHGLLSGGTTTPSTVDLLATPPQDGIIDVSVPITGATLPQIP
jgi:hypothetical protein